MKHVPITELDVVEISRWGREPIAVPAMTREQKLMHWAKRVRTCSVRLILYHGLEYMHPSDLKALKPIQIVNDYARASAMSVAVTDPVLNEQGLSRDASVHDIMKFFGLTQSQLHEFSCDCGGEITNKTQAQRIEGLACLR